MRSELVPVSAAALVTGVMALVLAQLLNPLGSERSPADRLLVVAGESNQWLAMSVLFFGGAATLILGMPAVLTMFEQRRGRGFGILGVAVFVVGCVGVGGLAALMLMFRAIALQVADAGAADPQEVTLVTKALEAPGLQVPLMVWIYGFLVGVLLMGIGLLRARTAPRWVAVVLFAFLATQLVLPLLGEGTQSARLVSSVGLLLLAAGFTGIATNATTNRAALPLTHSFSAPPAR